MNSHVLHTDNTIERREERSFFLDASHRSIVFMRGADVQDLLHRISTNDLRTLSADRPVQTILTNEKGRVIDVVTVLMENEQKLILVGESDKPHELANWLDKFIIMEDARVAVADNVRHFIVHGSILPKGKVPGNRFNEQQGGISLLHIIVGVGESEEVIRELGEAGLTEIMPEAYEEFRVAHGIPGFPNELSANVNPLEAGLRHLISWSKGCYVGQEVIARLDTYGKVQRRLARLECGAIPEVLPAPLTDGSEEAGFVTSASRYLSNGRVRAIGYVKTSAFQERPTLFLKTSRGMVEVHISS